MCHDGWDGNDARALCGILGFSQCKLILAIYTWICMHTITKSQLYTVETPVLVRVIELGESETSGAMTYAVNGVWISGLVGRMQD